MDESYWIRQSLQGITEANAMYRHRARVIVGEFDEAKHLWRDQRGKSFATAHLETQVAGIEAAAQQLSTLVESAETAASATGSAEAHNQLCLAALAENEEVTRDCDRRCKSALDLSGRASVDAGDLRGAAAIIEAKVNELLG